MGIKIEFKSDERKNINNFMLAMFKQDFQYDLHIRRLHGQNSGCIMIDTSHLRECENLIKDCDVDITSTAMNEKM